MRRLVLACAALAVGGWIGITVATGANTVTVNTVAALQSCVWKPSDYVYGPAPGTGIAPIGYRDTTSWATV